MAFDRLLQSIARLLLVYLQERCLELMVRATLLFVLDTVIVILDCATGVHFDDIDLSSDKVIHLSRVLDSGHMLLTRSCRLDFAIAGSCINCLTGLVLRLGLVVGW